MWLLNTATLKLEEFLGTSVPNYAILSHVWGKDEVGFQDLRTEQRPKKLGLNKLEGFCALAKSHNFNYAWMDTCCIDKTSSSELFEAINSMYRWYKNSVICYVYLEDVRDDDNVMEKESSFRKSRWFTRGWTLQELVAPAAVYFYSTNWKILGSKLKANISHADQIHERQRGISSTPDLRNLLSMITGISPKVLGSYTALKEFSVAQRLSWAASRRTTKPEDVAYCLMGLFDVNMPLIYGEGEEKAFHRLQEEILRADQDDTLFMHVSSDKYMHSILAPSPSCFEGLGNIEKGETGSLFRGRNLATTMTPKGLQTQLPICPCIYESWGGIQGVDAFVAILDCRIAGSHLNRGVIVLQQPIDGVFRRHANSLVAQLVFEKDEITLTTNEGAMGSKGTIQYFLESFWPQRHLE